MSSIRPLLQPILEHPALRAVQERVQASPAGAEARVSISGLTRPAKGIVAAAIAHQLARPVIVHHR